LFSTSPGWEEWGEREREQHPFQPKPTPKTPKLHPTPTCLFTLNHPSPNSHA